jgi:hypothetical protein
MALWEVNGELVYSDGALSIQNPSGSIWAKRHVYRVPYTNLGKGGITTLGGKTYHMPSWTVVHPKTTLDDIMVEKNPFEELFVEPKTWKFKSASSDKEYTVKYNAKGMLSCDCWGYIAHRKCKHIREVSKEIVA